MRVLRNPVAQFVVASLLLFAVIWWGTGQLSQTAARHEAVADARVTTELLAHSVAEPAIPKGLVTGDPGAIDRFDRSVLSRLLVGDVRRIKIWREDGTVVYSDETQLIGKRFPLDSEQKSVLNSGATEGGLSDLRRRENRFESEEDGLLEVYTRIDSPEGEPLLFEAYYSVATVQERAAEVLNPFRRISALGLLAILLARRADDRRPDAAADPRQPGARAVDGAGDRLVGGRAPPDRARPPRRGRPGAGRDGVRALRRGPRPRGDPARPLRADPGQRVPAPLPAPAALTPGRDPPAGAERRRARGGTGGPHRPGGHLRSDADGDGQRDGGDLGPRGGARVARRAGGDPQRGPARGSEHGPRSTCSARATRSASPSRTTASGSTRVRTAIRTPTVCEGCRAWWRTAVAGWRCSRRPARARR